MSRQKNSFEIARDEGASGWVFQQSLGLCHLALAKQFFCSRHHLVRLEAELSLKLFERR